jgi:hypothetical protein
MSIGMIQARTVSRSGVVLMARIVGQTNADVTQATLDEVAFVVRDIDAGSSGTIQAITIADSVFDTLQTNGGWDQDDDGYNFRFVVPASEFEWDPEAEVNGNPKPRRFRVDVRFTPTEGEQFVVPFSLHVLPTWIEGTL